MKVVKFGGSSLASAGQLEKVLKIVKSDPERRFCSCFCTWETQC